MQVFRSVAIVTPFPRRNVSARTLRLWCTPEVILAVTSLTDEAVLLPHIIDQARRGSAKVILTHVRKIEGARSGHKTPSPRGERTLQEDRVILDRMARQLRWLGLICEPVFISGQPELEMPLLVRSCDVHRVLVGFDENPDLTQGHIPTLDEQLLRLVDVPVCVIGRHAKRSTRAAIRNITLAISSDSRCEIPLSFACRLAQDLRAKLTVLHVCNREEGGRYAPTPEAVIAKLPFPTWREAELFCPTEVAISEGDPVDQILNYSTSTLQDLIILCSPGSTGSRHAWRNGVSYRTIAGAQCPVFVVNGGSAIPISMGAADKPEKFSASGEDLKKEERKEAVS